MLEHARRLVSHTARATRDAIGAEPLLFVSAVAALVIVSFCAVVIAKLLDDVMGGDDTARLDPSILDWFVDHRTDLLTTGAKWITHLGDPVVVAAVVAGVVIALATRRRTRLALFVLASSLGAAVATTAAKYAVDRVRPPDALWLAPAYGPSFPSGHATQSVACYLAIAVVSVTMLRPTAARVAVVAAAGAVSLLVGMSRVYLGVHWPSDVLCGWAVATLWLVSLLFVGWLYPRMSRLWSERPDEIATGAAPPCAEL
jgi:undecaprenyl-diphosphatase